ncbi:ATP-binding cassette domain-containing protein [Motiliproteus sp. MSK22-1]|uniref:ATP-binding cassette domain-containing protein n=1 Tax=Motiliproteus sp. MSK22-1 TaxID=1897630 RepID=UPI0009779ADD|nr:ATP-binding cassette domain-containing protein [Motiliproteus sp. MSK22-1]OMH38731.1 ABC transporter ATP-binding protein [Motiliproteus sp. MSK22-1]
MALLRLDQVSLAFGDHPLLDKADWVVHASERIALIGRNGAGKSTLLKLITGINKPDSGELWRQQGLKIGVLEQDLPDADNKTVYDVVASGLGDTQLMLEEYHRLSSSDDHAENINKLEQLQQKIEAVDGWHLDQRVERVLTRLRLPANEKMESLSGGWRRRVALGRALVSEPDILLLDEPTNHLDITTIRWLEQQLLDYSGTLIFITHDRSFLQRLATRIVELDRGRLVAWDGNYESFLEYRERMFADEERQNALFDKRLAQEEVWIRQGIKARRTRNEGRVRALKALRMERAQRREQQGKASFGLESAKRSGKLVAELEQVSYGYGNNKLVSALDLRIMRGDRIGLIGPNGAGKSTLLSLILGGLEPQSGKIERGTNLEVAYFDQLRDQLDLEKTVIDNVAEGREQITINGKQRHLISYLSDFLFEPARARAKVKSLSGGERNRLLLARLFSKPANLLVLDEPTNDLDLETLELLEELLGNFEGTLLLVSHDRAFLDNVVTSTLVFEGNGRIAEYVGGYEDWIRQGGTLGDAIAPLLSVKTKGLEQGAGKPGIESGKKPAVAPVKAKKLSYKLQRELDQLPAKTEELEERLSALQEETSAGDFYQQDHALVAERLSQLEACEAELETLMERWLELEEMQEG